MKCGAASLYGDGSRTKRRLAAPKRTRGRHPSSPSRLAPTARVSPAAYALSIWRSAMLAASTGSSVTVKRLRSSGEMLPSNNMESRSQSKSPCQ